MSPYLLCQRKPGLYRWSVKLFNAYYRLGLARGGLQRTWVRRYSSIRLDTVSGLPVYLTKCGKDLEAARSLIESSLKLLDEKSPIWGKRARSLFKSVLLSDKVEQGGYYHADRCCCVNPWEHMRDSSVASHSPILASTIVFAACSTFLLERHSAYLDKDDRRLLSHKAQLRFLLRCVGITDVSNALIRIKPAYTMRGFWELGISKDVDMVAMIHVVKESISKAQAAREKRLQRYGLR